MESFKASTQYGDWEGTSAADGANSNSVQDFLEEKGLIGPDEFLIACSFYVSEGFTHIRAFLFYGGNKFESVKSALAAISGPIRVREINVELTPEEFLGLFKRFHVMLTWNGFQLEGREFITVEN